MGIGTSLGAFFDDDHHYNASLWDPSRYEGDKLMEKTPNSVMTDQALDTAELDPSTGMGIEVGLKGVSEDTGMTDRYNTKLSPEDERKFQAWAKDNPRLGSTYDYDARGFWQQGAGTADNGHGGDTFKKPNHPTFSMDSKYNGVDGYFGGVWGEEDGVDTFKPSSTNLKNMSKEDLQDYFKRVEPNGKLLLDKPEIEDRRDDTYLETYQEILDGQSRGSTYSNEDNKLLERPYTKLEKEAGHTDIYKIELNQLVSRIQKGMASQKPIRPPTK